VGLLLKGFAGEAAVNLKANRPAVDAVVSTAVASLTPGGS
jgi:hypothetical protein